MVLVQRDRGVDAPWQVPPTWFWTLCLPPSWFPCTLEILVPVHVHGLGEFGCVLRERECRRSPDPFSGTKRA